MDEPELLLIPGPVPVPNDVLETMGRQMFNHRGPRYAKLITEVNGGIGWILGTKGEVHAITGSGTAGLEFALGNCIHPNDSVLCLSNGFFGERMAQISKIFGNRVKVLEKPYGKPILAEEVKRELETGDYDVVTCVFNESSTALRNPVREIANVV
jgi:aspartate aminotransferase-like enzyme